MKKESKQMRWRRTHPWARFVEYARRRCACADPRGWWPYYGAKGIKVRLTARDLEIIWHRDRAVDMVKPSLDRVDADGDYVLGNVRFIEFNLNCRRAWDKIIADDSMAVLT